MLSGYIVDYKIPNGLGNWDHEFWIINLGSTTGMFRLERIAPGSFKAKDRRLAHSQYSFWDTSPVHVFVSQTVLGRIESRPKDEVLALVYQNTITRQWSFLRQDESLPFQPEERVFIINCSKPVWNQCLSDPNHVNSDNVIKISTEILPQKGLVAICPGSVIRLNNKAAEPHNDGVVTDVYSDVNGMLKPWPVECDKKQEPYVQAIMRAIHAEPVYLSQATDTGISYTCVTGVIVNGQTYHLGSNAQEPYIAGPMIKIENGNAFLGGHLLGLDVPPHLVDFSSYPITAVITLDGASISLSSVPPGTRLSFANLSDFSGHTLGHMGASPAATPRVFAARPHREYGD